MDLKDKVVVVTGGASGLGRSTAEEVLKKGAKVAIFDLNLDQANQTASELGDNAKAFHVDVANEDSVKNAIQGVLDAFGAIHVAVNCAGIASATRTLGRSGPMPLDNFQLVININLVGTFNVLRLCAEQMVKNEPVNEDGERGVIVNTASVAAFEGQVGQVAYSASKAGVVGMTLPIARDLCKLGIRICTIAPGIFETPMMAFAPDSVRDPLIEMTQFPKRLGNPEEFASTAIHIMENTYLNGETIRIDSGIRMQPK